MASLSPVTAGRPVGEARFVRAILLPVRKPSLRRVFRDSDHAECVCVSAILSRRFEVPAVLSSKPINRRTSDIENELNQASAIPNMKNYHQGKRAPAGSHESL